MLVEPVLGHSRRCWTQAFSEWKVAVCTAPAHRTDSSN